MILPVSAHYTVDRNVKSQLNCPSIKDRKLKTVSSKETNQKLEPHKMLQCHGDGRCVWRPPPLVLWEHQWSTLSGATVEQSFYKHVGSAFYMFLNEQNKRKPQRKDKGLRFTVSQTGFSCHPWMGCWLVALKNGSLSEFQSRQWNVAPTSDLMTVAGGI